MESSSLVPAAEFNTPLSGRRYRKHSTRLIARLRKAFPDHRFTYTAEAEHPYARYTAYEYVGGLDPHAVYTAEQAETLLTGHNA
jgi:hypothetical protein